MNFKIFWILSIYTIWDGLSLKTISRYCPFKSREMTDRIQTLSWSEAFVAWGRRGVKTTENKIHWPPLVQLLHNYLQGRCTWILPTSFWVVAIINTPVIRSSLKDWQSMKKECILARHNYCVSTCLLRWSLHYITAHHPLTLHFRVWIVLNFLWIYFHEKASNKGKIITKVRTPHLPTYSTPSWMHQFFWEAAEVYLTFSPPQTNVCNLSII
jgi:hypothetical protein